jgi:hypothetical protein
MFFVSSLCKYVQGRDTRLLTEAAVYRLSSIAAGGLSTIPENDGERLDFQNDDAKGTDDGGQGVFLVEEDDTTPSETAAAAGGLLYFTPSQVAQAFSHFSYVATGRKRLIG